MYNVYLYVLCPDSGRFCLNFSDLAVQKTWGKCLHSKRKKREALPTRGSNPISGSVYLNWDGMDGKSYEWF